MDVVLHRQLSFSKENRHDDGSSSLHDCVSPGLTGPVSTAIKSNIAVCSLYKRQRTAAVHCLECA